MPPIPSSPTRPVRLRCNALVDPLGQHDPRPNLSWQLATTNERRGARQTAYRILVSTNPRVLEGDLWDSGWIESDATHGISYEGRALGSRQRAWWCVEVRDELATVARSEPAFWEMGHLSAKDWSAQWIGSKLAGGPVNSIPSPYLRTTFEVAGSLATARLYVTALGLYEFQINGQRVGEDVLTPGWTDYSTRVQYQVYDVTSLLHSGLNAAGAILGDGWYCGRVGPKERGYYGERPQLLAELHLTYADGETQIVRSDVSWKTDFGAILENDIIAGETHDARKELNGWSLPGYDDCAWVPVAVMNPAPAIKLSPTIGPLVRVTDEIRPVASPRKMRDEGGGFGSGIWVYDLGQNMPGRIRLHVKGRAGQRIKIRYAEILDRHNDNAFYTANLRSARVTDYYTLRGDPEGETWAPKFTFHGFRYVELSGIEGEPLPDAVTGVVLHSNTPRTGGFECDDPLVAQLQRNIDWGQRGNFIEVPTDCPQRDERLGWTGDAQVFIRTAAWNRDVEGFFHKWQRDLSDAQREDGAFPAVAPMLDGLPGDGGPAWAESGIICPWTIYLCYGDKRILRTHYESMKRYIHYMRDKASVDLIRAHPQFAGDWIGSGPIDRTDIWQGFGDWLALDGSGKTDGGTPKDLIGTAYFAYATQLMVRVATALGKEEEATEFEKLHNEIRVAYQSRFLTENGLGADYQTQTCYVLTLHYDLAPEALRPKLAEKLAAAIRANGNTLATGFAASHYLQHVLTRFGHTDLAFTLLHQEQWPSWLYAVTQGATTIWERWDGWTHDKGFQTVGMNSFNHYAYGAIGDWLYQVVAGVEIDPAAPGYKHIRLEPHLGGKLHRVRATLHSVHGEVLSAWERTANGFEWEVLIPPNTSATVRFPSLPSGASLSESGQVIGSDVGIEIIPEKQSGGAAALPVLRLASGRYRFAAKW